MDKKGDTLEVNGEINSEEETENEQEEKEKKSQDSSYKKENVEDQERYYHSIFPHFGHYSEEGAKNGYSVEFQPEVKKGECEGKEYLDYLDHWAQFENYYHSRLINEPFPSGKVKHLEGGDA